MTKEPFSFSCPKCQQLLVGPEAIRLRSRSKLTKHMQKLLRKKREDEKKLTTRQHELLDRAMQSCNVMVLKCSPCQWQTEIKLQSREALLQRKARRRQKAEEDRQKELASASEGNSKILDKKALKKLKKKERKKKAAERQAGDLQLFKRLSASPIGSATDRPVNTPMASTPFPNHSVSPFPSQTSSVPAKSGTEDRKSRTLITPNSSYTKTVSKPDRSTPRPDRAGGSGNLSGRPQTPGKQQLRNVLKQKKKANLSANESLLQFLDSMK